MILKNCEISEIINLQVLYKQNTKISTAPTRENIQSHVVHKHSIGIDKPTTTTLSSTTRVYEHSTLGCSKIGKARPPLAVTGHLTRGEGGSRSPKFATP